MFGNNEKNCLFIGPDRAGKTWFLAGTAYCLEAEAIDSTDQQTEDPELNQSLKALSDAYKLNDFDHQKLNVNNPDEFSFLRFQLKEKGLIRDKNIEFNTFDYAGEHIQAIKHDPENAYNKFKRDFDLETVPPINEIKELRDSGQIYANEIPTILSVLIQKADVLGLVLPMDDFATELSDDELPDHIDQASLQNRRNKRVVQKYTESNDGYLQIYEKLCKNNDFFFLATMSDLFLRTFRKNSGEDSPHNSWEKFREHVWNNITDKGQNGLYKMGLHMDTNSYQHLYPVYIEPKPDDPRTPSGNIKPKLDATDDHYSLTGLQYVLERIQE